MSNDTMYTVVGIRNLYAGALTTSGPLIWRLDEQGRDLVTMMFDEAVNLLDQLDGEVYYADSNEAGRPEYYILTDNDAEYIRSGRNGDGDYSWEDVECDHPDNGVCCGECKGCIECMIDEDKEYIRVHAEEAAAVENPIA